MLSGSPVGGPQPEAAAEVPDSAAGVDDAGEARGCQGRREGVPVLRRAARPGRHVRGGAAGARRGPRRPLQRGQGQVTHQGPLGHQVSARLKGGDYRKVQVDLPPEIQASPLTVISIYSGNCLIRNRIRRKTG